MAARMLGCTTICISGTTYCHVSDIGMYGRSNTTPWHGPCCMSTLTHSTDPCTSPCSPSPSPTEPPSCRGCLAPPPPPPLPLSPPGPPQVRPAWCAPGQSACRPTRWRCPPATSGASSRARRTSTSPHTRWGAAGGHLGAEPVVIATGMGGPVCEPGCDVRIRQPASGMCHLAIDVGSSHLHAPPPSPPSHHRPTPSPPRPFSCCAVPRAGDGGQHPLRGDQGRPAAPAAAGPGLEGAGGRGTGGAAAGLWAAHHRPAGELPAGVRGLPGGGAGGRPGGE